VGKLRRDRIFSSRSWTPAPYGQKAAGNGVIYGKIIDKFVDLADVVKNRSCNQEISIQILVEGGKL